MSDSNTAQGGVSLFGLAFLTSLVFTVLKLTDTIDWSWLWVLSPLWIYGGLCVIAFVVTLVIFLIFYLIED